MSMPRRFESLKGIEKAAGLLLSLPADESAKVLRCLEESYLERLTTRLLKPDELETEVLESILQEANALVNAEDYVNRGGVEYARSLLTDALGPARTKVQRFLGWLAVGIALLPEKYSDLSWFAASGLALPPCTLVCTLRSNEAYP